MTSIPSRSFDDSIGLLKSLIGFPSVSSVSNANVSDFVSEQLARLGFEVERTSYQDRNGVAKVNLVAHRSAQQSDRRQGGLAYFCHTDVVPAAGWTGPGGDPFAAVLRDDKLYGRGSCDMKGSLTAMLAAASSVPVNDQKSPLWIVCTADEEVGFDGAKHLVKHSQAYRGIVDAQPLAIIGEPTSLSIVHAHKGIYGFRIISRGRAAHSSTTEGINANEAIVPMLQTLLELNQRSREEQQYFDNRFDPPILSWNFGVSDGGSAVNITPEKSVAWVTLRSMPEIDGSDLVAAAISKAQSLGLEFEEFEGGKPFWNDPNADCIRALCELVGADSPRTVCYGTDGGEFTELDNRVVWGPGDIAQAHTTDEWLALDQLERGIDFYRQAIQRWCVQSY
ncbi:MAG: M20 family metallopeptidase [Rubripirellula sp.]